jgi:hypothetical protein
VPLQGDSQQTAEAPEGGEVSTPALRSTAATQLEVALYVESMSAELRLMARSVDLDSLAYFLEMVRIEASIQIERRAALT